MTLKRGPYGPYVEHAADGASKEKPKRVSLPQDLAPDLVDLETALGLLALPREIGLHPETGKPIAAGIGRFGAYVKHDGAYRSLPRGENVLAVGLNRAVVLIAEGKSRGAKVLRELGAHPADGEPVKLRSGRYGPYVEHRRLRASLPKDASPDEITLDQAVALLAAKAAQPKKKGARRGGTSASAKGGGRVQRKAKSGPKRQPRAPADGAP